MKQAYANPFTQARIKQEAASIKRLNNEKSFTTLITQVKKYKSNEK